MNTLKMISSFATATLLATSMANVYAKDADLTQTRSQDRVLEQLNLQVPETDFGQSQNREQKMQMNQHQNQYRYMNNYRTGQNDAAGNSMMQQNRNSYSWQGNNDANSLDRQGMMDRSMQGSSISGAMNRQTMSSRTMAGGRR